MTKDFLYVGHYSDIFDNFVLKVGTTNNLDRRRKEHTRNYRKSAHNPMPIDKEFQYDWFIPLSKYNTLRFEDKTKELWKALNFGEYVNNDRFVFAEKPNSVEITIRKTYIILL